MDLKLLETFVAVASLGSFAAVADYQNRDPSLVSRAIAQLEKNIGFTLFKRSTRRLTLTEAGARYLKHIEPLLNELQWALDDAKSVTGKLTGTLRVTASLAFGQEVVLPLLKPFRELHPHLAIDLQLTDDNIDLTTGDIDVAFRLAPALDVDLVGVQLMPTRYLLCASPSYVKVGPALASPQQLLSHDLVAFDLPAYRSQWFFQAYGSSDIDAVRINPALTISSILAVREAALAGLGIALLPDWLTHEAIARGKLVPLLDDYKVTATDFDTGAWLLYRKDKYPVQKLTVFVDFVKQALMRAG